MTQREAWWSRGAVLAAALLATLFTLALALQPLMSGGPSVLVRLLAAPTCHQMAHRSLLLDGIPMAVCARCIGIYAGGALGLWAYGLLARPAARPPVWSFLGVVALNVVDVGLGLLGLPNLSNLPRSLLGGLAGFVAALFLGTGLAEIALHLARRRRRPAPALSADGESAG